MPTTKTLTVLSNDVALDNTAADPAIGTANGVASTTGDCTTSYAANLLIRLTNGGTASTTPPRIRVEVSGNQTNWFSLVLIEGNVTVSSIIDRVIPLHPADLYVRTRSGNITGASATATVRVSLEKITAV